MPLVFWQTGSPPLGKTVQVDLSKNFDLRQAAIQATGRPRARTNPMTRPRTAPLRAAAWLVSSGCSRRFQRARVEALGGTGWRGRRVGVWATLAWCGAMGTR